MDNTQNTGGTGGGFNFSFLSDVASAIPQITAQFNKGYQENQLAIAQANAMAAEANATQANAKPKSNTIIWGVAIAAIVLIALILILRSN